MVNQTTLIGILVVAVLVVGAGFLIMGNSSLYAKPGAVTTPILLTDPPHVPVGTQAVIVTYSSLMVHTTGQSAGWVNATGSGSIDLMAVQNSSKVIGDANINANSSINLIRFNITATTIRINGTTYNASSPNNRLTVSVVGGSKINSTTGVLIDISPTVTGSVNSQGKATFTMVPAAKAVIIANLSGSIRTNIGGNIAIGSGTKGVLATATSNLSIG